MSLFPDPDFDARRDLLLWAHNKLCAEYECPIPFFSTKDALSELVSALLSHRTKNRDSGRAYAQLTERFPTWEAVRDAPTDEVEEAIRPCTWPEQKAPRLQAILHEITAQRGSLDLSFLPKMSVPEARAWMERLPGVGPKTSAAVLLFSTLRIPAMPVDSHHHRVAQRLGVIGPKVAVGPSHAVMEAMLPADWGAREVYDHHEVLMLHGQKCCFYRNPQCGRCPVRERCAYFQEREAG